MNFLQFESYIIMGYSRSVDVMVMDRKISFILTQNFDIT